MVLVLFAAIRVAEEIDGPGSSYRGRERFKGWGPLIAQCESGSIPLRPAASCLLVFYAVQTTVQCSTFASCGIDKALWVYPRGAPTSLPNTTADVKVVLTAEAWAQRLWTGPVEKRVCRDWSTGLQGPTASRGLPISITQRPDWGGLRRTIKEDRSGREMVGFGTAIDYGLKLTGPQRPERLELRSLCLASSVSVAPVPRTLNLQSGLLRTFSCIPT